MDNSDQETSGGVSPDQTEAPEPPPAPAEEGVPAPAEGGGDSPTSSAAAPAGAEPATAGPPTVADPVPGGRPARARSASRQSGGRLWAAAEARRATEAQAGGESAGMDGEVPDEEVEEAEQAVLADLGKLAAERDDYLDQLRRTRADFENYRKRILRQQTEHLERAAEALAEKLLPVLDTFDAALAHGQGFEQVHAALMTTLEKEGLERIAPEGKPFDPNESDAVAHEEGEGGPVVAEVLRPGYRWKGRVLRPAMVRVRG